MSAKKNINWQIDEFTSIDLVPAIKASKIKSSVTNTEIVEDGKKFSFKSSETLNDEQGRPSVLKNFNPKGQLTEEYRYSYNGNIQKIELFENAKKTCVWTNEYDNADRLILSDYTEIADDSHDIDNYTYDKDGRLVKILMDSYPEEVDEEEPATGYELSWNGEQLMSVSEIYGEDEEAKIVFEYDEKGQVKSVKKYIYLIDDEDEEVEELFDEQIPKFDASGRLVENATTFFSSNSKLIINYAYDGKSNHATHTIHKEYENDKLSRSVEFFEDESGHLLKSIEHFHQAKAVKTDIYTYETF
jgi:hypothetical protein